MMLMNSITNLAANAKSGFGTMNRVLRKLRINLQPKMPGDSKAGKQKNKLSP